MPDLLVRNLSAETMAALKARARKNNRSTQAEVAELIEKQVREEEDRSARFWAAADRAREEMKGKTVRDSAELIREDRDSR